MVSRGREPLVRLEMFANRQFTGGLLMFFFQFLIQAGLFFTIPLYLSVALGLSAIDTGLRIMPLSITLLLAAAGIPRFLPERVTRAAWSGSGCSSMCLGIISLFSAMTSSAGAGDRHRAAAAGRPRHRRARVPARQRHRLGRAGRRERRGGRPAEHRDEPRRVPGHRPGRIDPHRHADLVVPGRDRPQRRRSRLGGQHGERRARGGHPVRVGRPAARPSSPRRVSATTSPRRSSTRTLRPGWTGSAPRSRCWP